MIRYNNHFCKAMTNLKTIKRCHVNSSFLPNIGFFLFVWDFLILVCSHNLIETSGIALIGKVVGLITNGWAATLWLGRLVTYIRVTLISPHDSSRIQFRKKYNLYLPFLVARVATHDRPKTSKYGRRYHSLIRKLAGQRWLYRMYGPLIKDHP